MPVLWKMQLTSLPQTAPVSTLKYTHSCAGGWQRGGGEGSCDTQELEQDVPSVVMTRPVTPAMRKTDVLQKVSHCLILGGVKAGSLDIIFSSVFILYWPGQIQESQVSGCKNNDLHSLGSSWRSYPMSSITRLPQRQQLHRCICCEKSWRSRSALQCF